MVSKKSGKARLILSVLALGGAMVVSGNAIAECKFEFTKAGSAPLIIKPTDKDTQEAKEFLATCVNPYTKRYAADAEAAKAGKKKFGYYYCTQCHGGKAGGQTGPSITDDRWQYAKLVTDKGMFETIAGGTDAAMPASHQRPSENPELLSTDDILVIMGWLRSMYGGGGEKAWLRKNPVK